MIKKILKGISILILLLIIGLLTAPYVFKDKIKSMVLETINKDLDATVSLEDVDLSFFKNFPKASVSLTNLSVINKAPFEGDTLCAITSIDLTTNIKEIFKSKGEAITILSFSCKNPIINIKQNNQAKTNYDISTTSKTSKIEDEKQPSSFKLDIKNYSIENLSFTFDDQKEKRYLKLSKLNHRGKGTIVNDLIDFDTNTSSLFTLKMNDDQYFNNVSINLDAIVSVDQKNNRYSFKKNRLLINQLPLEFDGFVQLLEHHQFFDLIFKTPNASFKNCLGLIPAKYAKDLSKVKTTGNFTIDGLIKGNLKDDLIPNFDLKITSNHASFKFPDLPKAVSDININARLSTNTNTLKGLIIDINQFNCVRNISKQLICELV